MRIGGYTRKVDELGRVVFPIEIRRRLKIEPGDHMRISVEGSSVVIKKDLPECQFCGGYKNLIELNEKHICPKCLAKLNAK